LHVSRAFQKKLKKRSYNKANKLCWAFRKNFVQHRGAGHEHDHAHHQGQIPSFFRRILLALRIYYEIDAAESLLQFGFQAAPRHCFCQRRVKVCPLTKHLITKNVATCNKFHFAVAIASFARRPGK